MEPRRIAIRSYRRVFKVDRRIYKIDRWMLPIPGGIPLRGAAYFACAVGLILLLSAFPTPLDWLSPPMRYVVLPIGLALFASQATPDGRPAHRFALAWIRLRLRRPERGTGWSARVRTRWDLSSTRLQHLRVKGPAKVTFAQPVMIVPSLLRGRKTARGNGKDKGLREVEVPPTDSLEIKP